MRLLARHQRHRPLDGLARGRAVVGGRVRDRRLRGRGPHVARRSRCAAARRQPPQLDLDGGARGAAGREPRRQQRGHPPDAPHDVLPPGVPLEAAPAARPRGADVPVRAKGAQAGRDAHRRSADRRRALRRRDGPDRARLPADLRRPHAVQRADGRLQGRRAPLPAHPARVGAAADRRHAGGAQGGVCLARPDARRVPPAQQRARPAQRPLLPAAHRLPRPRHPPHGPLRPRLPLGRQVPRAAPRRLFAVVRLEDERPEGRQGAVRRRERAGPAGCAARRAEAGRVGSLGGA
mmetsp:Transcript_8559/g.22554  ORF Transcript_8559/g.22554 Transcript_8559/m.22554 type:complete len:292 (+) Transcript_8559:90-965(+)